MRTYVRNCQNQYLSYCGRIYQLTQYLQNVSVATATWATKSSYTADWIVIAKISDPRRINSIAGVSESDMVEHSFNVQTLSLPLADLASGRANFALDIGECVTACAIGPVILIVIEAYVLIWVMHVVEPTYRDEQRIVPSACSSWVRYSDYVEFL